MNAFPLQHILVSGRSRSLTVARVMYVASIRLRQDPDDQIYCAGFVGAPPYIAPELYVMNSEDPYDGVKTDVFSIGVILFIMLARGMYRRQGKERLNLCMILALLFGRFGVATLFSIFGSCLLFVLMWSTRHSSTISDCKCK